MIIYINYYCSSDETFNAVKEISTTMPRFYIDLKIEGRSVQLEKRAGAVLKKKEGNPEPWRNVKKRKERNGKRSHVLEWHTWVECCIRRRRRHRERRREVLSLSQKPATV